MPEIGDDVGLGVVDRRGHALDFTAAQAHRLLEPDGLARSQCRDSQLGMGIVSRRDEDRVDFVALQHLRCIRAAA